MLLRSNREADRGDVERPEGGVCSTSSSRAEIQLVFDTGFLELIQSRVVSSRLYIKCGRSVLGFEFEILKNSLNLKNLK